MIAPVGIDFKTPIWGMSSTPGANSAARHARHRSALSTEFPRHGQIRDRSLTTNGLKPMRV
jgi:hypothetical protein